MDIAAVQDRPSETVEGQEYLLIRDNNQYHQNLLFKSSNVDTVEVSVAAATIFNRTITRGQLTGYLYEPGRSVTDPHENVEFPAK